MATAAGDAEHDRGGRCPVSDRGQAGLLAGEAEALEGAGALEGEVVDEGEQRSHAGERGPAGGQGRRAGTARAAAAKPASTSGAGSAVVAPMPPASATDRHREGRAEHHGALGDRGPPEGGGGDQALGEEQGGPVELGVDADGGDVDRHEEGAEVEERAGGGRERRP